MRQSKKIVQVLFFIFTVFLLGFGYFRLMPILAKPEINIDKIQNKMETTKDLIDVTGKTKNVQKLYINGILTEISPNGIFESKLALFPKNNILEVVGIDKFGRQTRQTFNIYKSQ